MLKLTLQNLSPPIEPESELNELLELELELLEVELLELELLTTAEDIEGISELTETGTDELNDELDDELTVAVNHFFHIKDTDIFSKFHKDDKKIS